jgi:hypothetical protein
VWLLNSVGTCSLELIRVALLPLHVGRALSHSKQGDVVKEIIFFIHAHLIGLYIQAASQRASSLEDHGSSGEVDVLVSSEVLQLSNLVSSQLHSFHQVALAYLIEVLYCLVIKLNVHLLDQLLYLLV